MENWISGETPLQGKVPFPENSISGKSLLQWVSFQETLRLWKESSDWKVPLPAEVQSKEGSTLSKAPFPGEVVWHP